MATESGHVADAATQEAFEDFLTRREPALRNAAEFLTGGRSTGDELLDQVLVEIYPTWRSSGDPERYVGEALVQAHRRRGGVGQRRGRRPPRPSRVGHGESTTDAPAVRERARAIAAAATAAQTARARRRRRNLGAAVAGVVAVGVALGGFVYALFDVPAPPQRDVAPLTVAGVTATWLPDGVQADLGWPRVEVLDAQRLMAVHTASVPFVGAEDDRPFYLQVVRGGDASDLDTIFAEGGAAVDPQPPVAYPSWIDVAGERAVLLTRPASLALWWTAGGVLVGVRTENVLRPEASLADLRRVAEGVVVGPAPAGPADPELAADQIRAAVGVVYDQERAPAEALAVVEDGSRLVDIVDRFRRARPDVTTSLRARTQDVYFFDASNAVAVVEVDVAGPEGTGGEAPEWTWGEAVVVNGEPRRRAEINLHLSWTRTDGWRIPRDSYCRASPMLFNC